jgi:hypothetical protein
MAEIHFIQNLAGVYFVSTAPKFMCDNRAFSNRIVLQLIERIQRGTVTLDSGIGT